MFSRTIVNSVIVVLSCTLMSCTSVNLEYDKMTGTSFPQSETVSGDTVTLGTIYLQGGVLLVVDEDDTNIAPLTGPSDPTDPDQYDYITAAELQTLIESPNRSVPIDKVERDCGFWIFSGTCTQYYIYGIVADHFYERASGTRSRSTMGLMYDSANRSAFANFYKHNTVSGNNAKYLRSTAHEIGHAFNLAHCDGDGSTTIMNQTRVVGNTFTYEFSSESLEHLQDHPKEFVWPGISPFEFVCPHTH